MNDLASYRLRSAHERLMAAKGNLEQGHYKDAINRSYYAIFTAIRALLAERGVDFSRHSAVISYFQREFIKTGIFEKKFSKYLQASFEMRNDCDYADFFFAAKADAEEQYRHAEEMTEAIRRYLENGTHPLPDCCIEL